MNITPLSRFDKLSDILFIAPESPLREDFYKVFDAFTRMLSIILKDDFGWLEWYCHENNFGESQLKCKAAKWEEEKPIINLKELLEIIEADHE